MDEAVRQALQLDTLIDITTTGRRTGQPRRVQMWFHYQDGRILLTGRPVAHGWYANVTADTRFTWHFKESLISDIPARAKPITDERERRAIFETMKRREERLSQGDVDEWTRRSPLVEVELLA